MGNGERHLSPSHDAICPSHLPSPFIQSKKWGKPEIAKKNYYTFSSRVEVWVRGRVTVENNSKPTASAGSEIESKCQRKGLAAKLNDLWKALLCPSLQLELLAFFLSTQALILNLNLTED